MFKELLNELQYEITAIENIIRLEKLNNDMVLYYEGLLEKLYNTEIFIERLT